MLFVLYHAGCLDGFASAFAAWLTKGTAAQYLAVKYQEAVPALPGTNSEAPADVLIVDFSYPAAALLELAGRPEIRSVTVLDHHEGASAELSSLPPHPKLHVHFDMAKSGAVLTWEYLYPDMPVPELFLLVQDGDLWTWNLPDARAITTALYRGTRRKFETWKPLLDAWETGARQQLCTAGNAIAQADDQSLYILERGAVPITGPNGEPGLSVNTPMLKNDIAERILVSRPEIEWVSIWHESDGLRHFALRSRKGSPCDVAAIAALNGGGGHPSAAGYRTPVSLMPSPIHSSR
jgi:oligoribonuclease NrnB/cAMP/cGMP phosphodiesterase (DHH superfamily)